MSLAVSYRGLFETAGVVADDLQQDAGSSARRWYDRWADGWVQRRQGTFDPGSVMDCRLQPLRLVNEVYDAG